MKRRRRVAETRYFRRRRGIRGGILGGTRRTTRSSPGTKVDEIRSFQALGHGISYRTRRSIARARGVRRGGGIARSVSASEAGKHRFASPVVRSGEKRKKNHPGVPLQRRGGRRVRTRSESMSARLLHAEVVPSPPRKKYQPSISGGRIAAGRRGLDAARLLVPPYDDDARMGCADGSTGDDDECGT